jgi:hypothetical protein
MQRGLSRRGLLERNVLPALREHLPLQRLVNDVEVMLVELNNAPSAAAGTA